MIFCGPNPQTSQKNVTKKWGKNFCFKPFLGHLLTGLMPFPLGLSKDWQTLPEIIFGNIMTMIVIQMDKLEDLQKCRQVCLSWNMMISQMTKHKKDTLRSEAKSRVANWLLNQLQKLVKNSN